MEQNRLPAHLFLAAPMCHWMRYSGSSRPPKDFVGDWPTRGACYPCQILLETANGHRWVQIAGFLRPKGFKGFRPTKFRLVATTWLN